MYPRVASPVSMGRCNEEGFNSFRRWPSEAPVSLSSRAQRLFGQKSELTFAQMRNYNIDGGILDDIMDARPMADKRGERIVLDVDDGGHFTWSFDKPS